VAPGIALDRFVYSYPVYGETITHIDTDVAGCEGRTGKYIRSTGRSPPEIPRPVPAQSPPDYMGGVRHGPSSR